MPKVEKVERRLAARSCLKWLSHERATGVSVWWLARHPSTRPIAKMWLCGNRLEGQTKTLPGSITQALDLVLRCSTGRLRVRPGIEAAALPSMVEL